LCEDEADTPWWLKAFMLNNIYTKKKKNKLMKPTQHLQFQMAFSYTFLIGK
jgi:hypothetical protein